MSLMACTQTCWSFRFWRHCNQSSGSRGWSPQLFAALPMSEHFRNMIPRARSLEPLSNVSLASLFMRWSLAASCLAGLANCWQIFLYRSSWVSFCFWERRLFLESKCGNASSVCWRTLLWHPKKGGPAVSSSKLTWIVFALKNIRCNIIALVHLAHNSILRDLPVPKNVTRNFTFVQVACLAAMLWIKESPIGVLFPVVIALLAPLRFGMVSWRTSSVAFLVSHSTGHRICWYSHSRIIFCRRRRPGWLKKSTWTS